MVRLTADLILRSPQYFNALRERELDLRGNKIAVIENLGATEDQFDSIDLSDNEIVKLEGFPYLKRLTTLLVNSNRIARISRNLGAALPKLQTLVLTNNRLVNLIDLDPISSLVSLQSLSLLDNAVTKKPNYRLYVIHKLPKLRLLDFRKIKLKERQEADMLFGSKDMEIDEKPSSVKTFVPGEIPAVVPPPEPEEVSQPTQANPTAEQLLAIKAAIASSQTLEEVARLEKALKSGQFPADLKIPDDNTFKANAGAVKPDSSASSKQESAKVSEEQNGLPPSDQSEMEHEQQNELVHENVMNAELDGTETMEEG